MTIGMGPTVGFMGLGAIGRPMAERLVAGGADVVVYNRTRERTTPFQKCARIAESPAEVADLSDIVFSCLTSPQSYQDVIFGAAGMIKGGRVRTYVHTGTNEASLLGEIETRLKPHGIATIDAPVTGGVAGAAAGKLTVMAAGPRDAFAHTEPYLRHYASKVIYLSEHVGAAQFAKLVNNMLSAANLAIACETLVMGHKAGLNLTALLEVLNNGSGQNSATSVKIPKQVLTRAFHHGAALDLMVKDIRAFLTEAKALGVSAPLGEAVLAAYGKAVAELGGDADVTTVIRPMERAAGVELPATPMPV
jgi:3-hydroxyisobutyrate dehydrogenase-like beta-hydroxyacid dehydrogenase